MKPGPLERTSAEELLVAASGGNLPSVLIQCPEGAGGEFKQILGYLVQSRAGGFMVLLPAAEWVQPMIEALEKADGPDPLFHPCQVILTTSRQRLGAVDVSLVDLPWSMIGHFTSGTLPRSASGRRTTLHAAFEGTAGRPDPSDVFEVAAQWVGGVVDDDTAQDYLTGNEVLPTEEQPLPRPLLGGNLGAPSEVSELDELRRRTAELEQELATARRTSPVVMQPTPKAKSPALFANNLGNEKLNKEQWAHLHMLAGTPNG